MLNKNCKTTQKRNKVCNIIFVSSVVLLIVSLMVEITITNKYAIEGKRFTQLKSKKHALNNEIEDLELEISKLSSLYTLEEKAKELGFVENNNIIAVIEPSQFAVAR